MPYNPETGELRNECFPELETIARQVGISRSTLCRLLKRDAAGLFIQKREDGTWERWVLNLFIRVEPQYLERQAQGDERQRWKVRTSNRYYVAMDDPIAPGDEERVAVREQELLGHWQQQQAEEQQSEARRNEALRRGGLPTSECQFDTQSAVSKWHSESCVKLTQESLLIIITSKDTNDRSIANGDQKFSNVSKGKTQASATHVALGTDEEMPQRRSSTVSKWEENRNSLAKQDEDGSALEAAAQLMLHQLQEFGASNPDVGTKAMLDAFAEAGASPPCLTALVHVGANRVAQYQLAGNSILNISGFFITTMRGLAKEARALRWDVERLRMEDARKYVSQGQRLRGGRHATPDQETESTTQMNALPDQEPPEEQQMVVEAEAGEDDAETQAALEAERAWVERLQPTVGDWEGRQREVGMLWGFIRDALSPELNTAHRQSLHLLLPAADLDNRCLVLLTTLTYTARQTRIALLHKIEEKREKRLSGYFDTVRVELISVLPSWTKEGA